MKRVILLFVLLLISLSAPAEMPWQEGTAFVPSTNSQVLWSATNKLPSEVWIYKVMPEAFSAGVISNAMKLGDFQMSNKVKPLPSMLPDKHLIEFHNQNEFGRLRRLIIAPSLGVMEFNSEVDMKAPTVNVPSQDEAERLGRHVLFLLGVDRSLLSERVTRGYDQTRTKYSLDRKAISEPVVSLRGVAFERRIDGLRLSDAWCLLIHFGIEGRIESFNFIWRKITPFASYTAVTSEELLSLIKSGKAWFPEQPVDTNEVRRAEKFEVIKMSPRYDNGRKGEVLEYMYPYADLEMSASIGTNTVTFWLNCPITKNEAK